MEDYRRRTYKKYISTHFKRSHAGTKEEFELFRRYFQKNHKRFLPSDKNAKILDIGCGMGHFLYFLQQEAYCNVLGVDLSEENINFCKGKGFNVIKVDAFKFLEREIQDFDCIVMNDIIEHLKKEEILKILNLIKENLSEKGTFICKTKNASNPLTTSHSRYVDLTHEVLFTEESLIQVLMIAGFRQVKIYPQDIYVLKNPIVNILAKIAAFILHKIFHLLFLLHGVESIHIFTKDIIGVAKK